MTIMDTLEMRELMSALVKDALKYSDAGAQWGKHRSTLLRLKSLIELVDCEVCERCGKPATANYQKLWVKWGYDAGTDKHDINPEVVRDQADPWDEESYYYCAECGEKFESGE